MARRSSARRVDPSARAPGARPAPERRLLLLLPVVLALVSYLPTLGYDFVGDDVTFIQLNPPARELGSLGQSLGHGYGWVPGGGDRVDSYRYFRPLIVIDNTLDWVLSGGAPWLFHLANVLTHALAVAMLIWLARRLGLRGIAAAWIGTIFAIHPV